MTSVFLFLQLHINDKTVESDQALQFLSITISEFWRRLRGPHRWQPWMFWHPGCEAL